MYADFGNHMTQLLHYGFAFLLLLVLWPKAIFHITAGDALDRAVSRYILMVLLLMVVGYVLVAIKLFEILAIVPVLLYITIQSQLRRHASGFIEGKKTQWATVFYDYWEGAYSLPKQIKSYALSRLEKVRSSWQTRSRSLNKVLTTTVLVLILGICTYIRFYDAVMEAAPGMSDGYVTLAWIKYIDQRVLFHDGIYPQGFHIYMDYLVKFGSIDSLYVLKYTGPLNSMLFIFGLYFVVSRISRSKPAGLAAALIFGLLGANFVGDLQRQSSTNSQEFAFVFVLPTLYYLWCYFTRGAKSDLYTAFAGMAVTGLVHTLAFALLGLGVGTMLLCHFLAIGRQSWQAIGRITIAGGAAVFLSVLPLGIGRLLGASLHESSEEYLLAQNPEPITFPELRGFDIATAAAIVILLLWGLLARRTSEHKLAALFTGSFGAAVFGLYYAGGVLTNSLLISSRSGELWGIMIPFVLAMGWFALFHGLSRMVGQWRQWVELSLSVVLLTAVLLVAPIEPIRPYKLEWNSGIEQYLRITEEFLPKSFLVFSQEEGYAVVLGKGYHLFLRNLLNEYDPMKPVLTKKGAGSPDTNIPQHIFIYDEKKVFKVSEANSVYPFRKPIQDRREREQAQLNEWMKQYRQANGEPKIYYEDDHLRIYYLYREESKESKLKKIWGQ
jgi:hypothetical protein